MTIHKCHTPNCYNMTRAFRYCTKCAKAHKTDPPKTISATYDAAGNCTICGEAGRCPGYHAIADWPDEMSIKVLS